MGFEELFQGLTLEPALADAQPAEAQQTELEVASPVATVRHALQGPEGSVKGKGKSKGETNFCFKGEGKCKGKSGGEGKGGSDAVADGSDLRERQVAIGFEELFHNSTPEFSKG